MLARVPVIVIVASSVPSQPVNVNPLVVPTLLRVIVPWSVVNVTVTWESPASSSLMVMGLCVAFEKTRVSCSMTLRGPAGK